MYLREILLHYFIQKKSAAEAHRILVQTYINHALPETRCRFRRFKNNDFDADDKERPGAPKKFEVEELLHEDSCMSGASLTCRIISWSLKSFETFKSIRNDSKARILGAIQVEAERRRTASCHVWIAASTAEKESFFYIVSWPAMKSGYTMITLNVKNRKVSPAMHQHQ